MKKQSLVLKPGTKTEDSGIYALVGPRGGKLGTEVTSVQGNPLPPTMKPGQRYVLVSKTKHKK